MTAVERAGQQRSGRTGRRALVALGATLSLLPLAAGPAAAEESFINSADPCIGQPPAFPFADREEILDIHLPAVDCAVFRNIATGRDEGGQRFYRPAQTIPRDQMASLIMRTLVAGGYQLPAPQDPGFSDVERDNPHAPAISMLRQIDVVEGTTETTYAPHQPVRRDQMASFLVRAAEFAYEGDELDGNVVDPPNFVDVPPSNVHRENIFAAVRLIGVASGRTETMYNPDQGTRRDQMASFVVRLLDVTILPDLAVQQQAESGE